MKTGILRNSAVMFGLVLAVSMSAADPASAQEDKDVKKEKKTIVIERSGDTEGQDESVRVEIKDGRTWVNGVEVAEGDDISAYLPEGFDVSILDGDDRSRYMVFDTDDGGERRFGRFFSSDDMDDEEEVWVDGADRRMKVRRLPNRRQRPGSAFAFGGNEELRELRENLVEVGGDWGSRAAGFFADFGDSPTSPEVVKLEMESRRLGRELGRADDDSKQKLSKELDELLAMIFEKKTEIRKNALAKLKEKVMAEEQAVASRMRERDRIIAERKAELTGQSRKNDW